MKGLISIVLVALLGASFNASAGSVQLMAKSNGAPNPSIVGTTNLPDGTMLSTSITCPLMYPHCKEFWSGESKAVVHDGIFVSEPISLKYAPAPLDQYVITVVALAKQSPGVTSNLEAIGWNGSSIIAFHFNVGPDKNSPEMRARIEALERDSERKGLCGKECQQTLIKLEALDEEGIQVNTRPTVTMAEFSGSNGNAARQNGWTRLGENESDVYWFSYWTDKDNQEVAVVMKDGVKAVGNGYVQAKFITGFIDCRGSESGDFPSMLNMASAQTWSFRKGQPVIPLSDSGTSPMPLPVSHGTVMAEVIKRVCPMTADIWNDVAARNH